MTHKNSRSDKASPAGETHAAESVETPNREGSLHIPRQTHDYFTKTALQDLQVSRALLKKHLPLELTQQCDWQTLHVEPTQVHSALLRENNADLLFSVRMKNDRDLKILVHVEHLSSPKKWAILYTWEFCLSYLSKLRNKEKAEQLPVIVPLILYQNKAPYPHSNDIHDLFEDPALARQYWMQPIPIFNIAQTPDSDLTPEEERAALVQRILKYVVYPQCDALFYEHVAPLLHSLWDKDAPGVRRLLQQAVIYLYKQADFTDAKKFGTFLRNVNQELEGTVSSLAQQLSQKKMYEGLMAGKQIGLQEGKYLGLQEGKHLGLQEGKQLGLQEGEQLGRKAVILGMLARGASTAVVAELTDMSLQEVERIAADRERD